MFFVVAEVWSVLFSLLQSDVEAVQSNALHAAMDLVQAEGCSIAAASPTPATAVPEALANQSFPSLLRCVMLSGADESAAALRKEFAETFLRVHADLRLAALREIKSVVHLPAGEFKEVCKQWQGKHAFKGVQHIVEVRSNNNTREVAVFVWTRTMTNRVSLLCFLPRLVFCFVVFSSCSALSGRRV